MAIDRRDFFVSYNSADAEWAEWIAWQLEHAGFMTVLQAWDFRPGSNFVVEMNRATGAERTIAVLSPEYLGASFPQPEWAAAFAHDPARLKRTFVPCACASRSIAAPASPPARSRIGTFRTLWNR